jgi:Uma2 family endonuclease
MATTITTPRSTRLPTDWSLAHIQNHVGGVPLERILSFPPPGFATVEDVEELNVHHDRLCELIDGILVQKTAGLRDAWIATLVATELCMFVSKHKLGHVLPASGKLQVLPNRVRIPDACFIGWSRFPEGPLPISIPIPHLVPDLAVEILSEGNTPREMEQKRQDYFQAGVRLVWYIDPEKRSATVYTSAQDQGTLHSETEPLSGGDVLPGFDLSLAEIFRQADSQAGR